MTEHFSIPNVLLAGGSTPANKIRLNQEETMSKKTKRNTTSGGTVLGPIRRLFHRRPTTFIPGYDSITPFEYPRPDLDDFWEQVDRFYSQIEEEIDALASRGAIDGSHHDLVDRKIHHEVGIWRTRLDEHKEERRDILRQLQAQNIEHRTRLVELISEPHRKHRTALASHITTWESMTGLPYPQDPAGDIVDTEPTPDEALPAPIHLADRETK